jgi:hypothetical protein
MNVASEASSSLWMDTAAVTNAPALSENARADVAIVGAGIAGLSVAYELARGGKSVIVLDRGRLVGGMTARTSAHLTCAFDDYYHEHMRLRGEDETRAIYESQSAAIDRLEEIQRTEGSECEFRRALYWDTLDPYRYVRLQPSREGGDDWLIVGGEDHKTGLERHFGNRLARLEEWTRIHFRRRGRLSTAGPGRSWSPWMEPLTSGATTATRRSSSRPATQAKASQPAWSRECS